MLRMGGLDGMTCSRFSEPRRPAIGPVESGAVPSDSCIVGKQGKVLKIQMENGWLPYIYIHTYCS